MSSVILDHVGLSKSTGLVLTSPPAICKASGIVKYSLPRRMFSSTDFFFAGREDRHPSAGILPASCHLRRLDHVADDQSGL